VPRTQNRIIFVGLALTLVVQSGGAVEARHHGRHHHLDPDSAEAAMRGPPLHGGPLGTMLVQFIRDCERQAAELKNFPADELAQSIRPDDAQADALKDVRRIANEGADELARTCPQDMPADPVGRLGTVERGVNAVEAAIGALQPMFDALDRSLGGDQRTRLTWRYADPNHSRNGTAETTGSAGQANVAGSRRRSRRSIEDSAEPPPASQVLWNCEQWQAELRAWPVDRVEQSIAVAPRQRAAFYELAAAMQRAADMLADSCPQDTRDASLTPIGRIDDVKKKLDAMRHSFATIRSALNRFYEVLDGGQRARFNDAI
jgi:hypothetical protein